MTPEVKTSIRKFILELVLVISNKTYQERVWIKGEGPECDSYDETMMFFCEEYDISQFNGYDFTEKQKQYLIELYEKISAYDSIVQPVSVTLLNDKKWMDIQLFAAEVYIALLDKGPIQP